MKQITILTFLFALIHFLSCDDPIMIDDPLGFEPGFTAVNEFPGWTPDGTQIVFLHHGKKQIEDVIGIDYELVGLWIMDKDGSNQRKLLDGKVYNAHFSSDGNWLVFESGGQIYKAPFEGDSVVVSETLQLTQEGRNFFPSISQDGQWIAYTNNDCGSQIVPLPENSCGIKIIKSNGTDDRLVGLFGLNPSWHQNGKNIIGYVSAGPSTPWNKFVRYNPFDTTKPDTLNAVAGNDNRYPRYSPDGLKIVFASLVPGERFSVYTMNTDGTGIRRLTDGSQPSWSPDGSEIVFIRPPVNIKIVGLETIWIMDSNGTNIRQLTFGPE
ncbi:PD40 domain-containing protein [candidate division KSB1 bacterium]|nr:PD40 domain-containing protein [candidate division KSB1 bacterium]